MALTPLQSYQQNFGHLLVNAEDIRDDIRIQGQLIHVSKEVHGMEEADGEFAYGLNVYRDQMKKELMSLLVEELMRNNKIEYTVSNLPNYFGKKYSARIFAVPSTQVQIIRKVMK